LAIPTAFSWITFIAIAGPWFTLFLLARNVLWKKCSIEPWRNSEAIPCAGIWSLWLISLLVVALMML